MSFEEITGQECRNVVFWASSEREAHELLIGLLACEAVPLERVRQLEFLI
jgi:hypothetical protein